MYAYSFYLFSISQLAFNTRLLILVPGMLLHLPNLTPFLSTNSSLVVALDIKFGALISFARSFSSSIAGSFDTLGCEIQEMTFSVIINLVEEEMESVRNELARIIPEISRSTHVLSLASSSKIRW